MAYSVHISNDMVECHLAGRLTIADQDELYRAISEIRATARPKVVVDMARVEMVDLAALGMLVTLTTASGDHGALEVTLRGPRPSVRNLLEASGLSSTFALEPAGPS